MARARVKDVASRYYSQLPTDQVKPTQPIYNDVSNVIEADFSPEANQRISVSRRNVDNAIAAIEDREQTFPFNDSNNSDYLDQAA